MVSNKRLVKRAQKGDNEAFVRLIKEYENVLYGTAYNILKNDDDVADVLQNTILIAYEKLGTLKEPSYFNTWICRIMIHECYSWINQAEKNVLETRESHDCQNDLAYIEFLDLIHALDEKHQVTLILFYYSRFKIKEISEILGISEGTVKSRLSRAKEQLKHYLVEETGGVYRETSH